MGVFNASTSPPKEGYAVTETNVFELTQPETFSDPLTEVFPTTIIERYYARSSLRRWKNANSKPSPRLAPVMGRSFAQAARTTPVRQKWMAQAPEDLYA